MAEHLTLQQQDNVVDDLIYRQRYLQRVGLLGKRAYPPDDLGCSITVANHAFHRGARFVELRRIATEPAQARVAIGDDGCERLVHFVRDRSRQLSQSREASDVSE